MGTGTIVGVTKVADNGPDSSQWNLVIVGDGYTAAEQGTFTTTVDSFLAILQTTPPFSGSLTWDRINVHRLDVHSDESGAINPATCPDGTTPFGGSASTGVSFFDAEYCAAPEDLRRLLQVDTGAVSVEVGLLVPEVDAILVLVNHAEPGGSGAPGVAVSYGGGIYDGTAIHELGHSAFGLGDEYDFWAGCASGETGQDTYTGVEPTEPNLTTDTDRNTIKWAQYIDPLTPMPTTVNPNPGACDVQASPVAPGEIGAFDGAFYHHSGVYRPAYECMMRDKSFAEFCGVCAGVIAGGIVVEGSTCYIVTAVYGDPFATDVVTLREWRDRYLQRVGISGRAMAGSSDRAASGHRPHAPQMGVRTMGATTAGQDEECSAWRPGVEEPDLGGCAARSAPTRLIHADRRTSGCCHPSRAARRRTAGCRSTAV